MRLLEFRRRSLKIKLLLPFVLIFSASSLILSAVFVHSQRAALTNSIESKADGLAKTLATIVADNIAMAENDVMAKRLSLLKDSDPDVAYAVVIGNDNKCIASTEAGDQGAIMNRTPFETEALSVQGRVRRLGSVPNVFEVVLPVFYLKQRVGVLRLGISMKTVDVLVHRTLVQVALTVAVSLAIGCLMYMLVARLLTQPLQLVVRRLGDLARGRADLTFRLPVTSEDEIGQLAARFNEFLESMGRLVGQIRIAADQIEGSSAELSKITKETAEILSGSVELMGQIANSSSQASTSTQTVANTLSQMGTSASRGGALASDVFEKTKQVELATTSASDLIVALGEGSKRIGAVMNLLAKVTEKTNLLSLNAYIEAAQAGEAGRGFAVVADEIRRLADTSSANAQQIYGLIKDIQDKTVSTVDAVTKARVEAAAGRTLTEDAAKLFISISSEVDDVNKRMTQVAENTNNVAASTEEAMASAEEHAAVIERVAIKSAELTKIVEMMQSLVGQFQV